MAALPVTKCPPSGEALVLYCLQWCESTPPHQLLFRPLQGQGKLPSSLRCQTSLLLDIFVHFLILHNHVHHLFRVAPLVRKPWSPSYRASSCLSLWTASFPASWSPKLWPGPQSSTSRWSRPLKGPAYSRVTFRLLFSKCSGMMNQTSEIHPLMANIEWNFYLLREFQFWHFIRCLCVH